MKHNKITLIVLIVVNMFIFSLISVQGCEAMKSSTPEQRISYTQDALSTAQVTSAQLSFLIAEFEQAIKEAKVEIDSGVLPDTYVDDLQRQINEAEKKLADFKVYKSRIDESAANLQISLQSGDETKIITTGVQEVAKFLPSPYGTFLALGAPLIGLLGGFVGRQITAAKGKRTLKALIASVSDGLAVLDPSSAANVKQVLKVSQSNDGIRTQVQEILEETATTIPLTPKY